MERSGLTTTDLSAPERPTRAPSSLPSPRAHTLTDPAKLFNSSLEGNARRAIDFKEGDKIDEDAFKALIRAAAALNK